MGELATAALRTNSSESVPGFSIATHFFSPTQTTCLTEENLSVLKLQRKKKEERKHQPGKMCVRYTLLIANSLLALLGLLLLAGGVWRIVDDQSLRDVANELRDTAEWDNVAKEVTGWTTPSRRRPATSTSTMPYLAWVESPSSSLSLDFAEPRRRISASSPSTPSASSSSSCSRLLPSSSSMSTTQTSISSRTPSARRLRRLTLTLRS